MRCKGCRGLKMAYKKYMSAIRDLTKCFFFITIAVLLLIKRIVFNSKKKNNTSRENVLIYKITFPVSAAVPLKRGHCIVDINTYL